MNIRKTLEAKLSDFGRFIYRRKWIFLILMILVAGGFVSQLPKITVDTSNEGFLRIDDPIRIAYDNFRDKYGREEIILLVIETPDVFSMETLKKIRNLHHQLESEVPYIDEVSSLINARNTRGENDRLIVEDLLEHWPQNQQQLDAIRKNAFSNEIYQNLLLSEDGHLTTIMLKPVVYVTDNSKVDLTKGFEDSGPANGDAGEGTNTHYIGEKENTEIVTAVHNIVEKYQDSNFKITTAGTPIVVEKLRQSMQHDMQIFTKNSLLIVILLLALMFRRISGVVMPILVVILSLLSTFGLLAATGTPLKMPTQILPSFVLAVSVAASVHFLAIFYRSYLASNDKESAIADTFGHSGLAIIMTGITTAAGLLSFSTSEVSPISDLGYFAAAAVMMALMYNLILLPTLIAIFPVFKKKKAEMANRAFMNSFLAFMGRISTRHAMKIVAISAIVLVLSAISLKNLQFKHDPLEWMPQDWETVVATHMVDERLKGSTNTELIVDTGKPGGLYDPLIMKKIDTIQKNLVEHSYLTPGASVGKAYSVVDILKETNRALHANQQDFYTVPDERALIAQELLLFEDSGSDDLQNFVDNQFSQARISMKTPWIDANSSAKFLKEVGHQVDVVFADVADSYITGMGPLFVRTLDSAIESMKNSYLIAVVVISVMMILILGDFKLGLISMIPNLIPIVVVLGVMAAANIPLDLFTMLVGSIAVGLAVDDTIHFMHNFKRYYAETGDVSQAVQNTLQTTGRAILVTTLILCAGFFVFMGATMSNVVIFGAITGSTILLALLADLLLSPALMVLIYERKPQTVQTELSDSNEY